MSTDAQSRLLAIIDEMRAALSSQPQAPARLDDSLERDLGFDSLARMELVHRAEDDLGLRLPDAAVARIETPRELLRAFEQSGLRPARVAGKGPRRVPAPAPEAGVIERPQAARTLIEVLEWYADAHPERTHVQLWSEGDLPEPLSYAGLDQQARVIAAGLAAMGVRKGQSIAIMLPTGLGFLQSFFGALLLGAVPVPLYPPMRRSQLEDHLRRQTGILANCEARLLITVPEARPLLHLIRPRVATLKRVVTVEELGGNGQSIGPVAVHPDDIALLQYTSGSTGNPKGVVLTHGNLLANIRAFGRAIALDSRDVAVSWLPLYHDMGLIGAWLGSLYHANPLVLMSPLDFLARPERWLWAMHSHRGTGSAAPNFAFELCLRRIADRDIEGLDLSSWRLVANGAEPVSPDTIERFTSRFAAYGFRPETMMPMYGLAECAVALTIPRPGHPPRIDRIQREPFLRDGHAVPAAEDDVQPLRFVACGRPLPDHQVRIIDETGYEVPDRTVGRLQFCGPSATRGYFHNPEETRRLIAGDWLDTGDLAYLAEGELVVTSRVKDLIIRGGHNIHPYELEESIGNIPGIRKGCVAIFGVADPDTATERLVVVAETREEDTVSRGALERRIRLRSVELLGEPPDDIMLVPPHSVLKTSSGKIRRAATRDRYVRGNLAAKALPPWRQVLRLAGSGFAAWARRSWRLCGAIGYALRVRVVYYLVAVLAWPLIALMPSPRAAWRIARTAARALLGMASIRVEADGLSQLAASGTCVAVANHASYLDGLVLLAVLPRPFRFVAKRELAGERLAGVFLRSLGAVFVERFDVDRSLEDARRLLDIARSGDSLFFFPEGTFTREPGLRAFHMGAFVIAARASVPVLPVAIAGTRSILRGDGTFARRGRVRIRVHPAITPTGNDWNAAVALHSAARSAILEACAEHDLTNGAAGGR